MKIVDRILSELLHAPHMLQRQPWLKAWREQGIYPSVGIAEQVAAGVAAAPQTRIVFGSRERPDHCTVAELHREALAVAASYRRIGLQPGEVIAIQLPNWREGLVALLAAFEAGLIVVPIVPIYGARELSYILRSSQAAALVMPDQWRNIDFAARLPAAGDVPHLRQLISVGPGSLPGQTLVWRELLQEAGDASARHPGDPQAPCLINFTSGTTADPKGAVHTHQSLTAEAGYFPFLMGNGSGAPLLWPGPAGHIGTVAISLRAFLHGDDLVFFDHYDPELFLELMQKHLPDRSGGVPFQALALFETADRKLLGRLRQYLLGAASIPPSLIEAADRFGIAATRSYGSTEHPTISGAWPDDPLDKRAHSDGRLLAGNRVRIVDDAEQELPPGKAGEIHSMGPELFIGYLDPALNEQAFTEEGWFRTGDIGVLDAEGFLTIVDRKKDTIIRAGENISSREVEDLVVRMPGVLEAAAVAWPDARYGEKVGVFVRLQAGARLSLEDLRTHFIAAGAARQKIPEHLVIIDEFPRNAMGKIVKTELRKAII